MSEIKKLQESIHAWAVRKEWRGPNAIKRPLVADLMLFVSEIAEALEELRKNDDPKHLYYSYTVKWNGVKFSNLSAAQVDELRSHRELADEFIVSTGKPEGVGPELADLMIRVLETAEEYGLDMEVEISRKMQYNETRDLRHGGLLM